MSGKRLTPEEEAKILGLRDAKLSIRAIAEEVKRSTTSVQKVLDRYRPTNVLARAHLEAQTLVLVKRLIERAGTGAILEILDRLDILPAKHDAPASAQVGVYIGMPGALPIPVPTDEQIQAAKVQQLGPVVESPPAEG